MSNLDYEPLTDQLGIAATSYRLQIGLINGKWSVRLLKGKNITAVLICKDEDIEEGFPNQNKIINWVLVTIVVPNINPLNIIKTVQILLQQARNNKDKKLFKAPVKEAMEIKLKEVPSSKNKKLKPVSDSLGLYICPRCDFRIVNCPNCGKSLIKTN